MARIILSRKFYEVFWQAFKAGPKDNLKRIILIKRKTTLFSPLKHLKRSTIFASFPGQQNGMNFLNNIHAVTGRPANNRRN
ncbi:hypothetical protein [Mucilaginibacter sp.]|uniref:hypothetical protein n=1 Tax=Mucilaginibacter sp. TaxID=1882438 RepID=UPI0026324C8E|nr:hypothetical protein [Mucilaginibacter sp.]